MHKQIAESRNLSQQIEKLVTYIAEIGYPVTPRSVRIFRRDKTPGGYRVSIKKTNRVAAQKRYRSKVSIQLRTAIRDLESDVIIEDIAYCESYDWRW